MIQVAVLGAGGKMGGRVGRSLTGSDVYAARYIEPSESGRERLAQNGLAVSELDSGLDGADIVIFAVPDSLMGEIATDVLPRLAPGISVLFLDPAAIAAGRVQPRSDINCYVVHPTHPPLYSLLAETSAESRRDYWGGGLARQALVFATAWGDDGATADAVERLAETIFAPITKSHRISVDQMALLEPALSETLTNGCIALIREGMERVIAAGVPEEATKDFLMGHLQISIALIFEQLDWKMSDAALIVMSKARASLFRDDWYSIFEPEALMASVRDITGGN